MLVGFAAVLRVGLGNKAALPLAVSLFGPFLFAFWSATLVMWQVFGPVTRPDLGLGAGGHARQAVAGLEHRHLGAKAARLERMVHGQRQFDTGHPRWWTPP